MTRKKWSELADSTKKRYRKAGVTPQAYNAGKITPERKQEIYGKRKTSWLIEATARKDSFKNQFRNVDFDKLSLSQKARLTEAFQAGYLSKRSPLEDKRTLPPGRDFAVTPVDNDFYVGDPKLRIPNKHYGIPSDTLYQFDSKRAYEEYMDDMFGDNWDFDWDAFRDAYKEGF